MGINRFDLKHATGPIPNADLMGCIRLCGATVIPMGRDMLFDKAA